MRWGLRGIWSAQCHRPACFTSTPPSATSTWTSSRGDPDPTAVRSVVSSQLPINGRPRISTSHPRGTSTETPPSSVVIETVAPPATGSASVRSRVTRPESGDRCSTKRLGACGKARRAEHGYPVDLIVVGWPTPVPLPPAEENPQSDENQSRRPHVTPGMGNRRHRSSLQAARHQRARG